MKNYIVTSPYNFNSKWLNRSSLQRIAGQHGKITRPTYDTAEVKNLARDVCKLAVGPCLKGEALRLKGSVILHKGGVMPRMLMG